MIYTLRKAGDPERPLYELSKWDPDHIHPLDIYVQWVVRRANGSVAIHSCNCPSRSNPCKHAKMSLDLLARVGEDSNQLPFYYWEDGAVKETGDM